MGLGRTRKTSNLEAILHWPFKGSSLEANINNFLSMLQPCLDVERLESIMFLARTSRTI